MILPPGYRHTIHRRGTPRVPQATIDLIARQLINHAAGSRSNATPTATPPIADASHPGQRPAR